MIKVSPDVKFSYELVRGSVKDRQRFVNDINKQLFSKIEPMLDGKKYK